MASKGSKLLSPHSQTQAKLTKELKHITAVTKTLAVTKGDKKTSVLMDSQATTNAALKKSCGKA